MSNNFELTQAYLRPHGLVVPISRPRNQESAAFFLSAPYFSFCSVGSVTVGALQLESKRGFVHLFCVGGGEIEYDCLISPESSEKNNSPINQLKVFLEIIDPENGTTVSQKSGRLNERCTSFIVSNSEKFESQGLSNRGSSELSESEINDLIAHFSQFRDQKELLRVMPLKSVLI